MSRPDYAGIRKQALRLAEQDAAARNPPVLVRVTEIDSVALATWSNTWDGRHWSGYGGFDWEKLWHRHGKESRSFHCALWHGSVLCGLAVGSIPRGHSFLTIRCIESRPQGHPLRGKVAWLVLSAAVLYARGLELPQVRLENPAPGLEEMYRRLGFTVAYRQGVVRYLAVDIHATGA